MSTTFDKVTSELYHKGVQGMKWKNHTYKSAEELVRDAAKGKVGNASEYAKKVKEASKNDKEKDKDKKSSGMSDKKKANIKKYIEDVIKGKYGNGEARMKKLKAAGQDPDEVQHQVNVKLLGEKRANAIRDRKNKRKAASKTNTKSKKSRKTTSQKVK